MNRTQYYFTSWVFTPTIDTIANDLIKKGLRKDKKETYNEVKKRIEKLATWYLCGDGDYSNCTTNNTVDVFGSDDLEMCEAHVNEPGYIDGYLDLTIDNEYYYIQILKGEVGEVIDPYSDY